MKHWLMDILACPAKDCRSELHLETFESAMREVNGESYEEISEALITCPNCRRWYPVIDGIPCMLPDDLRMDGKQRIEENSFLERWKKRIPAEIIDNGIPFGLTSDK
ncbi:MAG: Trm112 family protein [Candidatus Hodarchaeota archaeon]